MNTELRVHTEESFEPKFKTASRQMKEKLSRLWRHAKADTNIFLSGETGTGKTTLARDIHAMSSRSGKPFVIVDCPSIPHQLFESELFGHKKGSFTSAHADHIGLIEQADGGTVFLDEISEIIPEAQSKLLRIIQDGVFKKVGDTSEKSADIRWISATHVNLKDRISHRLFREDLYFRLCEYTLDIPALRERREDIDLYAQHVFENFNTTFLERCSPSAIRAIMDHYWPGNVRQLQSVLNVAHIDCQEDQIQFNDIDFRDSTQNSGNEMSSNPVFGKSLRINVGISYDEAVKILVTQTLTHCENNIAAASAMLMISAHTLRAWLKKWGLNTKK